MKGSCVYRAVVALVAICVTLQTETLTAQISTASLVRAIPLSDVSSNTATSIPLYLATTPTNSAEPATESVTPQTLSIATPDAIAWLNQLVRENLPETYEDNRKWDRQKEVWDGVEVWRDGLKIETKRKKKLVNAGTWTKYSVSIVDPENQMHIEFRRLEMLPDSKVYFDIVVDCKLDVFGRLSQWARDVQVVSISANADATARLSLQGTVALQMNFLSMPPDIWMKPHVDTARIDVIDFRVRRISQIGQDVAEVLGKGLRETVDDKINDLNEKLVLKINQQLEKQQDKMRFSCQHWLTQQSVPVLSLPWSSSIPTPATAR